MNEKDQTEGPTEAPVDLPMAAVAQAKEAGARSGDQRVSEGDNGGAGREVTEQDAKNADQGDEHIGHTARGDDGGPSEDESRGDTGESLNRIGDSGGLPSLGREFDGVLFSLGDAWDTDLASHEPEIIGGGLLSVGRTLAIVAESNVGKSLLALDTLVDLAAGRPVWGGHLPVSEAHKVLYIFAEGGPTATRNRLRKIALAKGLNKEQRGRICFLDWASIGERISPSSPKGSTYYKIVRAAKQVSASVIVIDPLASFHLTEENNNTGMRVIMDTLRSVGVEAHAGVIIIHHMGKPGEPLPGRPGPPSAHAARGASSIADALDAEVTLKAKSSTAEQPMTTLELCAVKVRDGKKGWTITLGRDNQSFVHRLAADPRLCPPERVPEILRERCSGKVERKADLVAALTKAGECGEKTAEQAIKQALQLSLVHEEPSTAGGNAKAIAAGSKEQCERCRKGAA